jgi:hypothetical protein
MSGSIEPLDFLPCAAGVVASCPGLLLAAAPVEDFLLDFLISKLKPLADDDSLGGDGAGNTLLDEAAAGESQALTGAGSGTGAGAGCSMGTGIGGGGETGRAA